MADSLDILVEAAFAVENLPLLDQKLDLEECKENSEFKQLDQFGAWFYYLIAFDPQGKLVYILDRNGSKIWCPFWAYSYTDAITTSVLLAMEGYKEKIIEFSEQCVKASRLTDKVYVKYVLDLQFMTIKELEKYTCLDHPNKDWFLNYISGRKQIFRRQYKSLLEQ
jgi:hypothetical protein